MYLINKIHSSLRLKPTSWSNQLNVYSVPISTLQHHVTEFLGCAGPYSGDPPEPLGDYINPDCRCGSVVVWCTGLYGGRLDRRNEAGKFGQLLGYLLLILFICLLLYFYGRWNLPFDFLFPGLLSDMWVVPASPVTFLVMSFFLPLTFLGGRSSKSSSLWASLGCANSGGFW